MLSYAQKQKHRTVANLHSAAVQDSRSPILSVAAHFHVTAEAARHLIKRARAAGYRCDPVHYPVTAMVNPNSSRQKTWRVCYECLTTWPCPLRRTDQRASS